jgi:hypothetical protein
MSRALVVAAAGVALAGLAGCGGGGSTPAAPGQRNPGQYSEKAATSLAELDPCKGMSTAQLSFARFPIRGAALSMSRQESACRYAGKSATVTFLKDEGTKLDAYGRDGELTEIDVNGRPAAQVRKPGASRDVCTTVLSVGDGVVGVDVRASDTSQGFDGCSEALKYAKQIEPRLPKKS